MKRHIAEATRDPKHAKKSACKPSRTRRAKRSTAPRAYYLLYWERGSGWKKPKQSFGPFASRALGERARERDRKQYGRPYTPVSHYQIVTEPTWKRLWT